MKDSQDQLIPVADTTSSRLPYTTPVLRFYGAVAQMTQGTSGGVGDAGSQTMVKSDIALKQNIVRVGTHPSGFGLYFFEYKPEHSQQAGYGRQFGVMAQEVEAVVPDAVFIHSDGFKRVNYTRLGIQLSDHQVD